MRRVVREHGLRVTGRGETELRGFDFAGRGWMPPIVEVPDGVRIPDAPAPFIVPDRFNTADGRDFTARAMREFDEEVTARDNDPPREVVDAIIRAEFGPKVRRYRAKTQDEYRATRKANAAARKSSSPSGTTPEAGGLFRAGSSSPRSGVFHPPVVSPAPSRNDGQPQTTEHP